MEPLSTVANNHKNALIGQDGPGITLGHGQVKHKEKEDVKVITPYFSFIANIKDSYSDIHEKYTQAFLECKNSMKRR